MYQVISLLNWLIIFLFYRELALVDPHSRYTCVLWENETESEEEWKQIGTSKPTRKKFDFMGNNGGFFSSEEKSSRL